MYKQVVRLCRLQLGNLFGLNEFRHTKDRAKKKRFAALTVVWVLLLFVLVFYIGAFSYGLAYLGMAEVLPVYLYALVSLLILFLTFFKAGSVLFSMKGYEVLVALPVSKTAIVISRFLSMYLTNLLAAAVVMLPGGAVYSVFVRPGVLFYVVFLAAVLFLPLLPLTLASVLGAGITAISARVKHKSLGETLLMLLVIIGVTVGSLLFSDKAESMDEEMLKNLAAVLTEKIGAAYPPALWFHKALSGDFPSLLLLLMVPALLFTVFVTILSRYFQTVCTALNAVTAKNNFKLGELHAAGAVTALWKKELKRYFASSIYVTNTIAGYALAVLASAALLFAGTERMESVLMLPDLEGLLSRCLPFGLSLLLSITSITSCSISLEGKTFWQIQTLPVTEKTVYDSKLLASLTVAAPFYLVSAVLCLLAVKPDFSEAVWLLVLPACYVVFMTVVGLTVNLAFPVLNWESEVQVVKQSAATLVTMLIGMAGSLLPLAAVLFVKPESVWLVKGGTALLLFLLTGFLYAKNNRKRLISLAG